MYARAEVAEQDKQAVRQLLKFPRVAYHKGRVSGLGAALDCLGVNSDERHEMRKTCERLQPELEQQAEQAFTEQEELDAIERPASQARIQQEVSK